jgi:hypothetical protein
VREIIMGCKGMSEFNVENVEEHEIAVDYLQGPNFCCTDSSSF